MALTFVRGASDRPRGHAIVYFSTGDTVVATYVVVPPIAINLAKYLPPMLAGQVNLAETPEISAVPLPPVLEPVESLRYLERLAEARDDDLIDCGSISGGMDRQLAATAEVSQAYLALYQQAISAVLAAPSEPEPIADDPFSINDVMYDLMTDHAKVSELAKLTGALRYGVESGDASVARDTVHEIERLGRRLSAAYRIADYLRAALRPDDRGRALTALYIERCYKLANEDYAAVARLEAEIRALEADDSAS